MVKRKPGRPSLSNTLPLNTILEAALQVFSEEGYGGTHLKDIAQSLGVTNPVMSYRFENKRDLWEKAMEFLGDKLVERFHAIQLEYNALEGIPVMRAYVTQYIYFLAENPALYKILAQEMGQKSWRSQYLIDKLFNPLIWFGEKSIESPMDSLKEFKTIPRPNFISIILGASSSFFALEQLLKSQYGSDVFDQEQIKHHAEVVNRIIFDQFEHKTK